jgi:hypothetical protein
MKFKKKQAPRDVAAGLFLFLGGRNQITYFFMTSL